ncbi:phage recombination protein Bet [Biostraticola tofi]|uniref:Phage recombination protein Bet n=1 Tax=Biostraticola tofi TaxID=466109 RepID=A0A4V2W5M8_9GAMM|nr:phage recombination protein Bet [Biostraticola tofi]TCW00436.1 phage recombination protein Bet [Biostraticola tofi]
MANEVMNVPQGVTARGIDESTWSALKNSIYPGAKDESVLMAIDYCKARSLDPLMKPVHLVPMYVKDAKTGKGEQRDVVMPGVGLYRIQADRSGNYAGAKEAEFGPDVTQRLGEIDVTFPQWCKYTVCKMMPGGLVVEYSAKEYWIENYATAGRDTTAPNAMWKKRPYGQIAKCAEAQALRKAWPEIGQQPTAEEMEGKTLDVSEYRDVTPKDHAIAHAHPEYPADEFSANLPTWKKYIEAGKKTAAAVIATVGSKYTLSEQQIKSIKDLEPSNASN